MRRIFAIGETVFDIIFKDGKPVASTPGGSMLNTAVSLGRLGLDVYFISEYGNDMVGNLVNDFLSGNGVSSRYSYRYENYPSSLALAFLDGNNNAEYNFYKQYPEKRLDIAFPDLNADDIIIYGSFYGIDPDVHVRLKPFLKQARAKNAIVIYDPNFRTSHLSGMATYRPIIMENFGFADIIKGSNEDFAHIFGTKTVADTWQTLKDTCDVLVYTANKDNAHICMHDVRESYPVPPITPVSTIGAGDTFNAGLIYGLVTQNIGKNDLKSMSKYQCATIIENAIRFAGHVCMSYDNYISPEFAQEIRNA